MAEIRELVLLIDSEIDDELTAIAESIGRDKLALAREALLEWIEDQEDIRAAQEVIARNEPKIALEEVERMFGLES